MLIVLAGPSGVGKGTIVEALLARDLGLWKSVSTWRRGLVTVWFGWTDWDKGNLTKSESKHQVKPSEVEEVFLSQIAMVLGLQISPASDEERLGIVGSSNNGPSHNGSFYFARGKS